MTHIFFALLFTISFQVYGESSPSLALTDCRGGLTQYQQDQVEAFSIKPVHSDYSRTLFFVDQSMLTVQGFAFEGVAVSATHDDTEVPKALKVERTEHRFLWGGQHGMGGRWVETENKKTFVKDCKSHCDLVKVQLRPTSEVSSIYSCGEKSTLGRLAKPGIEQYIPGETIELSLCETPFYWETVCDDKRHTRAWQ